MRKAGSRVYETFRKKIRGSLQLKLTLSVLSVVGVVFLVLFCVYLVYFKNMYVEREVDNQREQTDRVMYGITTMQNTVRNVSQQVVVSDLVQENSLGPANHYVTSRRIQQALRTYTFIMDYISEILLYTGDGRMYSSFLYRDRFDPSKEPWYLDFKETGDGKGYTRRHTSTVAQNGRSSEVVSYVLTYYSVTDYGRKLGDLIINIEYSALEKMASMNTELLEGYAIYDKYGERVLGSGEVGLSHEEAMQVNGGRYEDERGNIYLVSEELDSGWIMVTEISGRLLRHNIVMAEILITLAFLALAFLISLVLFYNIKKMAEPINRLSLAAEQFGAGNFDVSVKVSTGDELEILADAFNRMVKDVQHYTEMSVEQERVIRRSQVDQLLLQINPHFIYNTMNSIVYMAKMEGNEDIVKFVNAFILLLQNMLTVENQVYTTLGEELKNAENYLLIQKYRYMDKFAAEIDCPEELKEYLVPKVILQPIIENAIFHGIAPMEEKGKLIISAGKSEDRLMIAVDDNGVGMSEEMTEGLFREERVGGNAMRKIGIANVARRIREICGEEYGLRIKSKEGVGTRVTIVLPVKTRSVPSGEAES